MATQSRVGVSDRIADMKRNMEAGREATMFTFLAIDGDTLQRAQMACAGDDDQALLNATPEIRAANAAQTDAARAAVLERKLRVQVDRWLDEETRWAVDRTKALSFQSPESLFAFLYQATLEERPELLAPVTCGECGKSQSIQPVSVTTVTRLMYVANCMYYAAVDAELIAQEKAS